MFHFKKMIRCLAVVLSFMLIFSMIPNSGVVYASVKGGGEAQQPVTLSENADSSEQSNKTDKEDESAEKADSTENSDKTEGSMDSTENSNKSEEKSDDSEKKLNGADIVKKSNIAKDTAAAAQADAGIQPFAETNTTVGGFTVTGGKSGTDFKLDGTVLCILTSTPLTIRNTNVSAATSNTIRVNAGVNANITLAGVNISGYAPFNLMANSKCHITLADGTTNTLNAGANGTAALHCGQGSTLVIDDSVLNQDANGNSVPLKLGKIGSDVTLIGGQQLKEGDPLTKLNSSNPGKLIAKGGKSSAGIGGGPAENSGNMTFEGGIIYAYSWGGNNTANANGAYSSASDSSGSGIGGGASKGGGTNMTFNAATVYAYASYHGAGIGTGWSSGGSTKQTGASTAAANGVCGNITINGGYIESTGYDHGNAFGQGCGGSAAGCTIKVTGGTLLPTSQSGRFDIGGSNGYVIITGGSVRCASTAKFQGIGNTAWGKDLDYTNTANQIAENKVFMTKIDLSAEGISNDKLANWRLLIDGEEYVYGAPSQFDAGRLYLWLPSTAVGKEITVDLATQGANGEVKPIDPLFIPKADAGGTSVLKRYVEFEIPEDYQKKLEKDYDGTPFEPLDVSKSPIHTVEAGGESKTLDGPQYVNYKYQLMDENGKLIGSEQGGETTSLPQDSGTFRLTMTSTQYANLAGFKESYWGHRAYGNATIHPVASQVDSVKAVWDDEKQNESNNILHITADITSGDGTAATCKAPTGSVQLYIDGKPVGDEIPLDFKDGGNASVTKDADSREHTIFKFDLKASEHDVLVPNATGDNTHTILVHYIPDKNYIESDLEGDDAKEPKTQVEITPIKPEFKVYDATDEDDKQLIEDGGKLVKDFADFSGGNVEDWFPLWIESNSHGENVYSSSNENIVTVDKDGKVHIKNAGTTTITVKKLANGAFLEEEMTFTLTVLADMEKKPDPEITKTAKNVTHPKDETRPGDIIEYTITAKNKEIGSAWKKVTIKDQLPESVELLTNTLQLKGSSEEKAKTLKEGDYTLKDGLLCVPINVIYGEEYYTLTFKVKVKMATGDRDASDAMKKVVNTANAEGFSGGTDPNDPDNPPSNPDNPDNPPNNPDNPDDPDDPDDLTPTEPVKSDPAVPTGGEDIIPNDPAAGDLKLNKTAKNLDRKDGRTHVGDHIRYQITVSNSKKSSVWLNTVIKDDLPKGLELVSDSIYLETPEGRHVSVPDEAYDSEKRILAVYVGDLYGGESCTLVFECKVTKDAVGQDIGNSASAFGDIPSSKKDDPGTNPGTDPGSDPGTDPGTDPKPGSPWKPEEGWDDYQKKQEGKDNSSVSTEKPVYPFAKDKPDPKNPKNTGIASAQDDSKDTKTVSKRRVAVPTTGDSAMVIYLPILMVLSAAVIIGVLWKKRKRDI